MKITVIGGSGATGSAVVAEAARRGHSVTSVTRSGSPAAGAAADVVADLADTAAVVKLVNASDATVIAVSPDRSGGSARPVVDAFAALIAARPTGRLVVVGGAGSLLDAASSTTRPSRRTTGARPWPSPRSSSSSAPRATPWRGRSSLPRRPTRWTSPAAPT